MTFASIVTEGCCPRVSAPKFPPFYQDVSQFKSALTIMTHSNLTTSLKTLSPKETTLNHQDFRLEPNLEEAGGREASSYLECASLRQELSSGEPLWELRGRFGLRDHSRAQGTIQSIKLAPAGGTPRRVTNQKMPCDFRSERTTHCPVGEGKVGSSPLLGLHHPQAPKGKEKSKSYQHCG